jgi:predicted PurR-regulated permease PerM
MDRNIVISLHTIFLLILIVLGVYTLYMIKPVIIVLLIAFIIVIATEHAVQFLKTQTVLNKPLSRGAAVLITYFLLIAAIISILAVGVAPVVTQGQKLLANISNMYAHIPGFEDYSIPISELTPDLRALFPNVFTTTYSILTSVAGVLTVLIISIYMSLDWENIKRRLFSLFTGHLRRETEETVGEIEVSIGHWIKGQLFLMLVVGSAAFIGLTLLGVEYALALALIAGLLEIVPILGPIVSMVLASIVGFSDSFVKGMAVIALFTLIQQLENNLLVPKVMHKVSGFSPLVILIALLVGSTLLGIVGALMAIPLMMILVIIAKRVLRYNTSTSYESNEE